MTRIAILSDSHDQIAHLTGALAAAQAAGAEVLLHCGDLCAPFMLNLIGERFTGPVHVVFGNNDGDGRLLQVIAAKHPQITLHGIYAELNVAGRQLAMIHYPEPARRIAQSGVFDLVCYGHDHTRLLEPVGAGWLLNPGEVLGMKGAASWALYDTETGTAKIELL
ncbi:MAG TPA: metallophosphoesterase family protein [Chloroflexi bacterium]|nr:metallophosphoesterase family protein [Chloroflexota bacterium]